MSCLCDINIFGSPQTVFVLLKLKPDEASLYSNQLIVFTFWVWADLTHTNWLAEFGRLILFMKVPPTLFRSYN